eukprot:s2781_g1.t1
MVYQQCNLVIQRFMIAHVLKIWSSHLPTCHPPGALGHFVFADAAQLFPASFRLHQRRLTIGSIRKMRVQREDEPGHELRTKRGAADRKTFCCCYLRRRDSAVNQEGSFPHIKATSWHPFYAAPGAASLKAATATFSSRMRSDAEDPSEDEHGRTPTRAETPLSPEDSTPHSPEAADATVDQPAAEDAGEGEEDRE